MSLLFDPSSPMEITSFYIKCINKGTMNLNNIHLASIIVARTLTSIIITFIFCNEWTRLKISEQNCRLKKTISQYRLRDNSLDYRHAEDQFFGILETNVRV